MSARPAWVGYCTGCHRDGLEVASRSSHHERVLCERCAASGVGRRRDLPAPAQTDDEAGLTRNAAGLVIAVDASTWAAWEADRRRAVKADRASRPVALETVAAKLTAAGLRPVIDRELGCVHAVCPHCGAGADDGLWRPYTVAPRRGKLLACCSACAIEEVQRA